MKRIFKTVPVVLCVVFLLGTLGQAFADVLSDIKEKGVITVGTSADYPPYEFKDESDNFVGFDMELMGEIAKRMGVKLEVVDMGFDTLIAALQNNKVDAVIAAMQATPERDEKVDFTDVYHNISDAFLVKAGSGIKMNSPYDAAGLKIASQTGTIQEKWIQDNLVKTGKTKAEDVFSYERVDNAAMDVGAGRVDVLFIISDPAKKHAEKEGLEIALITTETVAGGQSVAVAEGEAALRDELNKVIAALKEDGTIQKLMDKYGLF